MTTAYSNQNNHIAGNSPIESIRPTQPMCAELATSKLLARLIFSFSTFVRKNKRTTTETSTCTTGLSGGWISMIKSFRALGIKERCAQCKAVFSLNLLLEWSVQIGAPAWIQRRKTLLSTWQSFMPTWESVIWNLPPLQPQAKGSFLCHFPAASQIIEGNQVLNEAETLQLEVGRKAPLWASRPCRKVWSSVLISCFVIAVDSMINITAAQRQRVEKQPRSTQFTLT